MSEPQTYKGGDWEVFARQALSYHEATRPNDDLVVHKIETFRRFMSETVILNLGGFVRLHPRFNTARGWDKWVQNVGEILADRRVFMLALTGLAPPNASLDDALARFKAGKSGICGFWQTLDELVVTGSISSTEQREFFWSALSEEDQARYFSRCPAVDPADEVWEKSTPDGVRRAEQAVAEAVEFSYVDEQIRYARKFVKYGPVALLLSMLLLLAVFISNWPGVYRGWHTWLYIFTAIANFGFPLYGVRNCSKNISALRRLKLRQRDLDASGPLSLEC